MIKHFGGTIKLLDGTVVPLTKAVQGNDIVFVSGQLAFDETGKVVGNTIEEQTKRVLENIQDVLKAADLDLNSILKCTCWITNKENFSGFNKAYSSFFPSKPPARSTLRSDLLVDGALVEIEAMALSKQ